jgi:NAD(P)-dependent dehydrogenase (short-subunit alcohol dehydrogenase family)
LLLAAALQMAFAGKVALITGGAKGIGLACARALGVRGAKARSTNARLRLAAAQPRALRRW